MSPRKLFSCWRQPGLCHRPLPPEQEDIGPHRDNDMKARLSLHWVLHSTSCCHLCCCDKVILIDVFCHLPYLHHTQPLLQEGTQDMVTGSSHSSAWGPRNTRHLSRSLVAVAGSLAILNLRQKTILVLESTHLEDVVLGHGCNDPVICGVPCKV